MLRLRSLLVPVLALLPVLAAASPATIEGPARVIDGDTVEVAAQRVRLFGIDAPEARQTCDLRGKSFACGRFAAAVLRDAIGGAPVACEVVDAADRYGRPVAICRAGGRDLGATMVRQGAAVAYLRYSDLYAGEEAEARADGAGIWATQHSAPEAVRAGSPQVSLSAQGGCAIKGNISGSGERIYHLPGQAFYDKTRISAPGERMFCTEDEARAAGFRRAKR